MLGSSGAGEEPPPGAEPHADRHIPVLVNRVDELLAPAIEAATADGATDVVLVDATLGMAGHTLALLAAHPRLRVVGIDRDPQALAIAAERIATDGLAGLQEFAGNATGLFYTTDEAHEGSTAFLEKRPPEYTKYPRRP